MWWVLSCIVGTIRVNVECTISPAYNVGVHGGIDHRSTPGLHRATVQATVRNENGFAAPYIVECTWLYTGE